jgi:hypothetical protein
MIASDFKAFGIDKFSAKEITDTGANLKEVQAELIVHLNGLRHILGRPIGLVFGGLTTGEHISEWHGKGLAADFVLNPADGDVVPEVIFKFALQAGFKGIGLYWGKSSTYSFHVDLRPSYAFWMAIKNSDNTWDYHSIDFDPKNLKVS